MSFYYVLTLEQEFKKKILTLRTELYRKEGDASSRELPPVIMLGEAKNSNDVKVPCPEKVLIGGQSIYQDRLILPVQGLDELDASLQISNPINSIFLCNNNLPCRQLSDMELTDIRLALLEVQQEGPLLIWRYLWQKRLRKDTGKQEGKKGSRDSLHGNNVFHAGSPS
jgi:hypothetical protein